MIIDDNPREVTDELLRTVETLFSSGDVVELRMFKDGAISLGFFDDFEKLIETAEKHDGIGYEVYVTLNQLKPELLLRKGRSNNVARAGRGDGAKDSDVVRRRWLFIDADPERVSGISSTDAEKQQATIGS